MFSLAVHNFHTILVLIVGTMFLFFVVDVEEASGHLSLLGFINGDAVFLGVLVATLGVYITNVS